MFHRAQSWLGPSAQRHLCSTAGFHEAGELRARLSTKERLKTYLTVILRYLFAIRIKYLRINLIRLSICQFEASPLQLYRGHLND